MNTTKIPLRKEIISREASEKRRRKLIRAGMIAQKLARYCARHAIGEFYYKASVRGNKGRVIWVDEPISPEHTVCA